VLKIINVMCRPDEFINVVALWNMAVARGTPGDERGRDCSHGIGRCGEAAVLQGPKIIDVRRCPDEFAVAGTLRNMVAPRGTQGESTAGCAFASSATHYGDVVEGPS
jgi:hypothetical protein